MTSSEFILSGILESYVIGSASPEEKREVEHYAAMYPEVKAELEKIEETMGTFATAHSIQPPSHLKQKIMAQIAAESSTANEPIVRTMNTQTKSGFSVWSVAASLLFLVSAVFAIYFGVKNNQMETTMQAMAKNNAALADSLKSIASNMSQMHNDMNILEDPSNKVVVLKGQNVSPQSKAMVCWNPEDKKVYVEIEKLPSAPQGMQYQLWAIVDGKPVSEGMLTAGIGFHPMKDVEGAQAFAISLEKEGGNPTPKGDIYVLGAI